MDDLIIDGTSVPIPSAVKAVIEFGTGHIEVTLTDEGLIVDAYDAAGDFIDSDHGTYGEWFERLGG